MRVLFFGSGEFGLPTLARLASTDEIVGVVSQPDRPAGRGAKPTPTPIAAWAQANLPGIPILKPERVADPEIVGRLRELALPPGAPPACFVIIAFGQKIPRALLDGIFAINLHASLLPRWRGAAPINAAILAGDTTTGNSVITLADRMDAGEVLGRSTREIPPEMTAGELHDLLARDGPALVERVLRDRERNALSPEVQDESAATRAPKLTRAHALISFDMPADECRRRIHAYSPWPGVQVLFRGETLKLLRARSGTDDAGRAAPGQIIDPRSGKVACASGVLFLREVQPAGKKAMSWVDFANGRRVEAGEALVGAAPGC